MNPLKQIEKFNVMLGAIASALVWVGMVVIVYEVIARYLFNNPSVWGPGYTQRVFAAYFILVGAYTLVKGGHVRVDILLNTRSPRWNAFADVLNYSALIVWTLAISYESWFYFIDAWDFNEVDDSALRHPMWPVYLALLIGSCAILAQGISGGLISLYKLIVPNKNQECV